MLGSKWYKVIGDLAKEALRPCIQKKYFIKSLKKGSYLQFENILGNKWN